MTKKPFEEYDAWAIWSVDRLLDRELRKVRVTGPIRKDGLLPVRLGWPEHGTEEWSFDSYRVFLSPWNVYSTEADALRRLIELHSAKRDRYDSNIASFQHRLSEVEP